jgi:hypothetical protein
VTTDEYIEAVICRAKDGRFEDCLEFLSLAVAELDSLSQHSQVLQYLRELLSSHLEIGVPLEQALARVRRTGGRPVMYPGHSLAALDILLRDHFGFSAEAAVKWIGDVIGADRRIVQRVRAEYDGRYSKGDGMQPKLEAVDRDILLIIASELAENFEGVLPQTSE